MKRSKPRISANRYAAGRRRKQAIPHAPQCVESLVKRHDDEPLAVALEQSEPLELVERVADAEGRAQPVLDTPIELGGDWRRSRFMQEMIGEERLFDLLLFGGFIVTQWVRYQRQSLKYQIELTDNIYYRNINNNAGIFDYVIGAAEEQQAKEAFLAYH